MKLTVLAQILFISLVQNIHADDASCAPLTRISQRAWIHSSFQTISGYRIGSNGLVIDTSAGVVLIDTCWNDRQTEFLLANIRQQLRKRVILAVITHAYVDRIGGIGTLRRNGIKVTSTTETSDCVRQGGFMVPSPELSPKETVIREGDVAIEVYYPGPGHTKDNITVWLADDRVLFGGCLIKSKESTDLGNVADADVVHWASSVKNLKSKFSNAKIVVPGHGSAGTIELLQHTIDLCPFK